jgi:glycosyltransferase involved in cell wall biosynthesis
MVRNAFALAQLIADGDWSFGKVEVVVGLRRDGPYDWAALESAFRAPSSRISVRRMDWTVFPTDTAHRMFPALPATPDGVTELAMPVDRVRNFLDCDAWIVFGNSLEGVVAPLRPLAVYCADLIQRYVPEIFDGTEGERHPTYWGLQEKTFLGWRRARCVFATTPQTIIDAIGYAGVRSSCARLVPTLIDALQETAEAPPAARPPRRPYFLWVTNPSAHKNHPAAVEALRIYYEEMDGLLELIIVGPDSHLLDPASAGDYAGTRAFRKSPRVLQHTHFDGEVSNAAYLRMISGAAFVWHNVIVDNGTFVAFDVARAGRHLVSSDYPQMRYLCERYGVAPIWFPAADPRLAAEALMLGEQRFTANDPPAHQLRTDTPQDRTTAYGSVLRQLFEIADA